MDLGGGTRSVRAYLWRGGRWGIALLLAGVAAWLSVRQIQWEALGDMLRGADLLLLALALSTVLATTVAKAVRWHILLRQTNTRAGGARIFRVLCIGQMGNSLLPARLGDMARAVLIGPRADGGVPAVLGTIVVEKALDGVMGLVILVGLALWTPLPSWLRGPFVALALLTVVLLAPLLLAVTKKRWATDFYRWLTGWLPETIRSQMDRLLERFGVGLALFKEPHNALLALACSAVIWGLAALTNTLTLAAVGVSVPGWTIWLVLITGYVSNFLPTVPAQIGVFEYSHILAIQTAGVGHGPALAYALLLHLLVYGPPVVLGPLSMFFEGVSWARLNETRHNVPERDNALA
jgi:hypothetical protein